LEKEIADQEDSVTKLEDFEEKLPAVADLELEPDLVDGVVLNMASLRELVPWKEAEKHWNRLLDSQYEWSIISQQLRKRGVISD
jgi:hypothetical protein